MVEKKENAAKAALELVKDGMVVGLGSGSTAAIFIKLLGVKASENGWRLRCVPTSEDSRALAIEAGLKVVGLDEVDEIHLAVDGADAVDENRNLIKGGGGCHAREKIVAYAAKRFACIVDESKLKKDFGGNTIPIEVLPFAWPFVRRYVEKELEGNAVLRKGGCKVGPIVTDNGNFILDAVFKKVENPAGLEERLQMIPGVVANGLFAVRRPDLVIIGKTKGVETLH